jgi:GTP-binding protein
MTDAQKQGNTRHKPRRKTRHTSEAGPGRPPRVIAPVPAGPDAAAPAAFEASQAASPNSPSQPTPSAASPSDSIDPHKLALAWAHTARFLTTASQLHHLPATELPEVAFVGRSNAGKSTAINTLAQQGRLAFASKTPGRTQHINLFELGPRGAATALWADLPGYGYAAVARDAKLRWQQVMASYLDTRRSLSCVVLMVDSRLGLTELDRQLLDFVSRRVSTGEVRLLVLLTKADKLNRKEAQDSLARAQESLAALANDQSDIQVTLFSALKKTGVGDVAQLLHQWCSPAAVAGLQ